MFENFVKLSGDRLLPKNLTWKDLETASRISGYYATQDSSLLLHLQPIVVAVILCILRSKLNRKIYSQVSQYHNEKKTMKEAALQTVDSNANYDNVQPKEKNLSKEKLKRICDSLWNVIYYSCSFIFGFSCSLDNPYFWDHRLIWKNFPFHPVHSEIHWYYMMSIGHSLCSCFFIYREKKDKNDFHMYFLHHGSTIFLLYMSWLTNTMRLGSIIILLHDSADVLLQV